MCLSMLGQIVRPDPSMAFVFIDENLYTIGVSGPQFTLPNSAYYTRAGLEPEGWDDVPGVRHGGTATVSFADGHSELHRWLEPSTFLVQAPTGLNPAPGSMAAQSRHRMGSSAFHSDTVVGFQSSANNAPP